nr:DMTF1-like protein [Parasacculina yatsui]
MVDSSAEIDCRISSDSNGDSSTVDGASMAYSDSPADCRSRARRVAVMLSDSGEATAVALSSVTSGDLRGQVLTHADGRPVILDVLDSDADHKVFGSSGDATDPAYPVDESGESEEFGTLCSWRYDAGSGSASTGGHKTGMWSRQEVDTLVTNIDQYCKRHNVSEAEDVIFRWPKSNRRDFYRYIARGINRPLFAIYRRVIRMYDSKNHMGRYSSSEVEQLRNLRAIHGNSWQLIGRLMGRSAASVKDRVRVLRDNCNEGRWFVEEEQRLERAMLELMSVTPGELVTSAVNWSAVAAKVKTRSEKQCRTKWLNHLSWKRSGGDEWTRDDDINLIETLTSLDCSDEQEVSWSYLFDTWPRRCVRSAQWLRARWSLLKKELPNHHCLSFREAVEALGRSHVHLDLVVCRDQVPTGVSSSNQEDTEVLVNNQEDSGASSSNQEDTGSFVRDQGDARVSVTSARGAEEGQSPDCCTSAVFLSQNQCLAPMGVTEDGQFLFDPLSEVGFGAGGGSQVMVFTSQPPVLLSSSGVVSDSLFTCQPVVPSQQADLSVSYTEGEVCPQLCPAPLSHRESAFEEQPSLVRSAHDAVIRGDPILSGTAPPLPSEEDGPLMAVSSLSRPRPENGQVSAEF